MKTIKYRKQFRLNLPITKTVTGILILVLISACKPGMQNTEPFEPSWESLTNYECPDWFLDAKFGIYFHWGPYSVPAYKTEWYSHYMYNEGDICDYHEKTYGTLDTFGYKDFIPMFRAENFNADEWAELFLKSGARFAGPVAEHADGFAMWNSELTEWDAFDMGPKRDIVGEMEQAIRKRGMKFITTYHRHWLYSWYPTWDRTGDASNPEFAGLYGPYTPPGTFTGSSGITDPLPEMEFSNEWLARLEEIMDKYKPDLIWFDNKMHIISEQHRLEFLSAYYNKAREWGRDVVCTYKSTDLAEGSAVLDLERSRMKEKTEFPWLTDDSVDWGSWCNVQDPDYKTTNRLIDFLVDVVSKNGALLLNIPPTASGEIPGPVQERLLEMGEWLDLNGEAIYGTRPWKVYGEGTMEITEGHLSERLNPEASSEDIRFTRSGSDLYAIMLGWPSEEVLVKSLAASAGHFNGKIRNIIMLGSNSELHWDLGPAGLTVKLPGQPPCDHAFVLKISTYEKDLI